MIFNLFFITIRYIKTVEEVDQCRPDHLEFIKSQYENGTFIVSGPLNPRYGGLILAHAKDRQRLWEIIYQDPFYKTKSAEFQIYEFTPTNASNSFKQILNEVTEKYKF